MSNKTIPCKKSPGIAMAAICLSTSAIAADVYPHKPVRIIAAFPPGGFVDLCARVVAAPLGAVLGQQVIVDNRGGAGDIVGTELAARATPDGYTLIVGSVGTHAVNQTLYRILRTQDVREKLNAAGAESAALATGEFAAFVKSEVAKWGKVVTVTGMTVD